MDLIEQLELYVDTHNLDGLKNVLRNYTPDDIAGLVNMRPLLLAWAIEEDNEAVTDFLVEKGFFIPITSLYKLINTNKITLLKKILDQFKKYKKADQDNFDINKKNEYGRTMLSHAFETGKLYGMNLLRESGADMNSIYTIPEAIHIAVQHKFITLIPELVQHGVDINKRFEGKTPFYLASDIEDYDIMQLLLDNGADINKKSIVEGIDEENEEKAQSPLINAIEKTNLELIKFLITHGADINTIGVDGVHVLHDIEHSVTIINYLIEHGANVNATNNKGNTPLIKAIAYGKLEVIRALLDAGADVNHTNTSGKTALEELAFFTPMDYDLDHVAKIKLLMENGAIITPILQNAIDNNTLNPEVIKALVTNKEKSKDLWKGWTKSQAKTLDTVFDEPESFSVCPVCLKNVSRQDGCMYMRHNCSTLQGRYNKTIYDVYKTLEGEIYWCTLCNRICLGHSHYELSLQSFPVPELIRSSGDLFATDCRPYGGGLPEKIQRFRRLREYALELNDSVGKISAEEAFDQLTEEFWNAPVRREEKLIKKIINAKAFNTNSNLFLENRNNTNGNTPNIPVPPELVMPTLIESGENSIGLESDVPVLHFHHETTGGLDHNDSLIGVKTVMEELIGRVKNFGDENFGYCIMYPECKARLYPDEIKPHVPDELYEEYKKKFNKRFTVVGGKRRTRKSRLYGGGNENTTMPFFGEATNATCVVKGGRRTRKNRRKAKKSRKSRKN